MDTYSMKTSLLDRWSKSFRKARRPGLVSRARVRRHRLALEMLEDRITLSLTPQMVLDINTNTPSSSPSGTVAIGSTAYFAADDGAHGVELWKSNGTTSGTVLVKDINPGGAGSYPTQLTNVNGTLFFTAGSGLWRSDGTEGGTFPLSGVTASNLTNANGTLFFAGDDGTNGNELWKSDGTVAGTTLVKDIYPGVRTDYYSYYFQNSSNPSQLTNVNGTLFFSAEDALGGELWKSDGTEAGTVPLISHVGWNMTNLDGTLFFASYDPAHASELWQSDGSSAGTMLVKDININPGASSYPSYVTSVNGKLYFTADDGEHGRELWTSDGSSSGTIQVTDIYGGGGSSTPSNLTNVNGMLYFSANDGVTGGELWRSDGTAAGTVPVKDIDLGSASSSPSNLTNVNGTLFFTANDGTGVSKLWQSDRTTAGTVVVSNLAASSLTNVNGTLLFSADDGTHGQELWKLVDGPSQVASLNVSGFPTSVTAGVAGSFTVTAKNADGSTNTNYRGTVHLTSSDPRAVLSGSYTFTAADLGVHTFTATLKTAGSQSITVSDPVFPTDPGTQEGITVNPAAASRLTVAGFPSPVKAGTTGAFSVTITDPFGNRVPSYTGTVHFTSTDPLATVSPAGGYDAALDFSATDNPNGVWSYGQSITLTSAFQRYTQAGPNNENPPPANLLDTWNAGTGGRHSYPSVLHNGTSNAITSNAFTYLPGQLAFHPGPNGQYSVVRWTAPRAGSLSLEAAFSGLDFGGPTTTDVHILRNGAALFNGEVTKFGTGPSFNSEVVVAAGDTIDFAVGYGSNGTYYSDTTGLDVFISYDTSPPLITDYTFTPADAGTHTFSATFGTVGVQSLTATDTATPSITGAKQNIEVTPPAATNFVVSGFSSPTTAGTAATFTVTAKLANGSTASGYAGTVHFTSSDGQAGLPSDYTFAAAEGGVHTFSATLKTAGTQSLTVREVDDDSISGTQSGITVNPATASRLTVTGFPSPVTAGVAGSFTVTAQDAYGNRASGYTGAIHFTSSDAQAALPGNYSFTAADAGMHTFSAVLKTAGTRSVTATDSANSALVGAQSITINPAAASRLVISAPNSVTANTQFGLTFTAVDAFGNIATAYRGTLSFRSSDPSAKMPKNYAFTATDQGVHAFSGLVLKKKGKQTITVTDTLNGSLTVITTIQVL
jgi:ELWxxDGT repeat protein